MALVFRSSFMTRLKAMRDASSMQTRTNSQPMPRWRLTPPVCRPVIRWPTKPIRPSFLISIWMSSPAFARSYRRTGSSSKALSLFKPSQRRTTADGVRRDAGLGPAGR